MGDRDRLTTAEKGLRKQAQAAPSPPPQDRLPCAFGPYVLLKELKRTPSHVVYLAAAEHLKEERCPCIVKQVIPNAAQQPEFEQRFAVAGRRLVHLDHRNVAQVFDTGEAEGIFFLAQEYVVGCSLHQLLLAVAEKKRAIPLDVAVLICVDFLRGLHHALRQPGPQGEPLKLWHGRLAPRHVLTSAKGEVKIIDFDREWDVAAEMAPDVTTDRSTMPEGDLLGRFTAPEMIAGEGGSPASDVFSVGLIVRRLLGDEFFTQGHPSLPGNLTNRLREVFTAAVSPNPAQRPREVGALLLPLRQALHRLNPRCGPPDLQAFVSGLTGAELKKAELEVSALVQGQAPVKNRPSLSPAGRTDDAGARTLLLDTDDPARARAVDRVVGEPQPLAGTLPGTRYRILRPIGEGGMGTVYAAEHVDLEKVFALKILNKKTQEDRMSVVEGLRREARATSKLGHPNIVSVTDFGETPDGRVFFVMEYLEGQSLGEVVDEAGKLAPRRLLPILIQVCDGLAAAHEKGLIHRDIKPDNIFLVRAGDGAEVVKLLDFGVAVASGQPKEKPGHIAGTPYYMSPEMIRMKPLDGRSDLYSLGVLAYEALSGVRPFGRRPVLELLRAHLREEPKPLRALPGCEQLSPELEAIVMRCLHKKPEERFSDAAAMAHALRALEEQFKSSDTLSVPESVIRFDTEDVDKDIAETWTRAYSGFLERQTQRRQRGRTLGIAGLGLAGLLLGGGGWVWWSSGRSNDAQAQSVEFFPAGSGGAKRGQLLIVAHPSGEENQAQPGAVAPGSTAETAGDASVSSVSEENNESSASAEHSDQRRSGKRAEKARSVRRPLSRSAQAASHVEEGQSLLARGDLAKAEAAFREALNLDRSRADALAGLGRAAFQRGDYQQAEQFARRAMEQSPDSIRYRLDLGAALFRLGRTNDAALLFRQVLVEHPDNEPARRYLQATQRR